MLLFIVMAALWVRLHGIGRESLWIDEVISRDEAMMSLGDAMRRVVFADVHPGGYILLLHGWSRIFGTGDLALRGLSLLAGVACVVLLGARGSSRWGTGMGGTMAAALLAFHAGHIHYSQEMRAYALLALWLPAVVWAARSAALESGGATGKILRLSLIAGCGPWLHHIAWLYMAGLALSFGLIEWPGPSGRRRLGAGLAAGAALGAPWLPVLVHQMTALPPGFLAHMRRPPDPIAFARILGSWGGLAAPALAVAGIMLLLFLAILPQPWRDGPAKAAMDNRAKPCDGSVFGGGGRLALTAGLAGLLLSLPLPLLLPATPLQKLLLGRAMLPGSIVAVAAPIFFAQMPQMIWRLGGGVRGHCFWCRHRPAAELPKPPGQPMGVQEVAMLCFAVCLLLCLGAIASGHLGTARNLVPLIPLACWSAGRWVSERWAVALLALILLGALPSALWQSDHVAPRPDFDGALRYAAGAGIHAVVVDSRFDAPAAAYAATRLGLAADFVRPAPAPARPNPHPAVHLGAQDAILLTRSACPDPPAAPSIPAISAAGSPARHIRVERMRGLCLVLPQK